MAVGWSRRLWCVVHVFRGPQDGTSQWEVGGVLVHVTQLMKQSGLQQDGPLADDVNNGRLQAVCVRHPLALLTELRY